MKLVHFSSLLLAVAVPSVEASSTAPAQGPGSSQNPLAKSRPAVLEDPFLRRFAGDGLELELAREGDGYAGELARGAERWPARFTRSGETLRGRFTVGEASYELTATLAGDVLTLETGGARYRLQGEKQEVAGFQVPPPLEGVGAAPARGYAHPKGYFSFEMPEAWSVGPEAEDTLFLNPGLDANDTLDAIVLVSYGRLDQGERNRPPARLLDDYSREFEAEMTNMGIRLTPPQERARSVLVGEVPGGVQEWAGRATNGQALRVWLGAIVKRDYYLSVGAILVEGKVERFLPGVKQVFFTLAPKPPTRNVELERALAGRSIGKSSSSGGGFFGTTYAFGAGNQVKKEMLMSGVAGVSVDVGGSSEEWGSYEVIGDELYMYFRDGQESGTLVRRGGELTGVDFGGSVYAFR